MVPSSVIAVIAFATFWASALSYFLHMPKRLIVSLKFLFMGGSAAILLIVIILGILQLESLWASWILLLLAIACGVATVRDLMATMAATQQQARAEAERIRRGV